MKEAKKIWEELPEDGSKWSEKDLKSLTGLNIGKIKEAKKWMKEHELIQSYRGRGGYCSRVEGAEFPVEANTMTAAEKRAASQAEKRMVKADIQRRRDIQATVIEYVGQLPEGEGADKIECSYITSDNYMAYVWVWNAKSAIGYKVYVEDAEYYTKGKNAS
jgi:hypothetical protein